MSSTLQVAANQANAQLSTGPRTEEGKKRSSLNALKTGLTGRTILLPGEDAEAYRAHCQNWLEANNPVGHEETELVQSLADTRWRQDRAFALEQNLFALGQVEFSDLFSQELPEVRNSLIQAHTFRAYQKEFRSLITQQGRLDRCFLRDLVKLHELQQRRKQAEAAAPPNFAKPRPPMLLHPKSGRPLIPPRMGLNFQLLKSRTSSPRPTSRLPRNWQEPRSNLDATGEFDLPRALADKLKW